MVRRTEPRRVSPSSETPAERSLTVRTTVLAKCDDVEGVAATDPRVSPIPLRAEANRLLNSFLRSLPKEYKFYTMPGFEFDPQKSTKNKGKHGIDFKEVQALWQDPRRLEVPARTEDEPRFLMIGTIGSTHWAAVITYRDDRIRIISARRARTEEVRWYEGEGV